MTHDSWTILTLAQNNAGTPQAGAAPATPAQPVNPVGVPGASQGTTGTSSGGSQPLPAPSSGGGGLGSIFWLFPVMIIVMFLMTAMTGRKDKKKKAELLASVKKGDKVQMIGGEIGTVADLNNDEIVLRVEEGRIRFARSALQVVLSSKSKPESTTISELKGEPATTSV